jgi:hypothetical protein
VAEQVQHHRPPPTTVIEFCALLDAGLLITTGGEQLVRRECPDCGSPLLGSRHGAEDLLVRGGPPDMVVQRRASV